MYLPTIADMIAELIGQGILPPSYEKISTLNGGTISTVGLITYSTGQRFVVKANDPESIRTEVLYLQKYGGGLLPKPVYVHPDFTYMVYPFLAGTPNETQIRKHEVMNKLSAKLINHYEPTGEADLWGWPDELAGTWNEFLVRRLEESRTLTLQVPELSEEDWQSILQLAKSPQRNYVKQPYLLHGDCGYHNFIFSEQGLTGIIDPAPIFGQPIYDFIYAFCSTADDLSLSELDDSVKSLYAPFYIHSLLPEEMVIGLWLRIATCIKYHPQDLKQYIEAFRVWKRLTAFL